MDYGRRTPIAQNSRAQALRCWTTRNLQCGHCCHLPVMAGDVTHPKHDANSVFSRRDIEIFERWFRCGDPKETGELDAEGLKRLWKSLQMDVTQMSAKWLIALADDSRNGKLNFGEFLYLWMMAAENSEFQSTPEGQAMLRTLQAFEIYPVASEKKPSTCYTLNPWVKLQWDMNKDGLLDGHEIQNMFQCLRIPISPSALHAIVQYFDEDMDGTLNFREFLLMWRAAIYDPDFQRTAEGCKMVKHMRIHNLLPNQAKKPAWG
ncbi:hypothetical protein HPB51_005468 [Rhipicephalus microplus]|uniref:EF-hand domain-containing protein n=1 Tax=Rhipicephalus microplus TaxID=6941 RepID=A0A9J6EXN1_RHIMP|nr:hypothetical protein HPB51_005468 [Rhipicephalus microplus]